mmetsp:Transcript_174371/g.558978  ORF Transcript_174371/g.558978 Transcript_174371/m.558978 type:complete len:105 (+) Transcript_174371:139-453(+)
MPILQPLRLAAVLGAGECLVRSDHGVCVALSIPGGLRRHRGRVFVLSSGQHVSEEVLRMSERHGYTPPTTRDAEDVDRAAQAWLDHDNAGFAGAVMDDPFDPGF